jgi:hypothetical protein
MGVTEQPGYLEINTGIKEGKQKLFWKIVDWITEKVIDLLWTETLKKIKRKQKYLTELSQFGTSQMKAKEVSTLREMFVWSEDNLNYYENELYIVDIRWAINKHFSKIAFNILIKLEKEHENTCIVRGDKKWKFDGNVILSRTISANEEKLLYDVMNITAAWYHFNYRLEALVNKVGYDLSDFRIKHLPKKRDKKNNQLNQLVQQEIEMLNQN